MIARALLTTLTLGACAYDARFSDCTIRCTPDTECPDGFQCGAEGLCRAPDVETACAPVMPGKAALSCVGLAATCGPTSSDDCCSTAMPIPGSTYYRSYDVAADGMYPSMSYPATVSDFRLDRYEVTVGRFRKFVEAGQGTQADPPIAGVGARSRLASSGWDVSWNMNLVADTAALFAAVKCTPVHQTWTDTAGANENLPMNCIDWFEAFAFCAWDGGFLPTEAEWNYAAAGGSEQRAYPWSNPASALTIDCSYANYYNGTTRCVNLPDGAVERVGNESPKGDGKWGQADLAGNVWERTLDGYQSPYTQPCSDCADLNPTSSRVIRGGGFFFGNDAPNLRGAARNFNAPNARAGDGGVRCAKAP